jgi:hypothetical protein
MAELKKNKSNRGFETRLNNSISGLKGKIGVLATRSGVLVVFAVAMMGILSATAVLSTQTSFSNTGTISAINVEVYWDIDCLSPVESIDWGDLMPGQAVNKTIYVKNSGTTEMVLNMTTLDWSSLEAEEGISLSWDRQGATVGSDQVLEARLTLEVDPLISGVVGFEFDIVIEGSG